MGQIVIYLVSLALLWVLAIFTAAAGAQPATETSSSRMLTPENIEAKKKLTGEWNFTLGGRGQSEGKDEGLASFVFLEVKAEYKLIDNLKVFFQPRLELYSSRVEQRFEDDLYESRLRFINGFVQFNPWQELALKAGAHSQEMLDQPLLISRRRTFPGAQEILKIDTSLGFSVRAAAQQLVPTSSTMNTERAEKEGTPSFFTESLRLATLETQKAFTFGMEAGHYKWNNLPSKTAFNSALVGNQIIGNAVTNSRFKYDFNGWFGGVDGCYCALRNFKLGAAYQRLHNGAAAGDSADGQAWSLQPKFVFKDLDLGFEYWNYFVESDATVAMYTAGSTTGTNRIGHAFQVTVDLKKYGFLIESRWDQTQPINRSLVQKTSTEYYLGLESHYVAF